MTEITEIVQHIDCPITEVIQHVSVNLVSHSIIKVTGDPANQAEAEAGTSITVWMSPLRVYQAIIALGALLYAKISGTTTLGLITASTTINPTTNTEYTGNITANITLNLTGFIVTRKTVKVSLDLVSASGPLTVAIAGYTFYWPPNQTQTLTNLADGSYDILFSWNSTTGKVVPRVQQVA